MIDVLQSTADAGPVTGRLKVLRNRPHALRQLDVMLSAAAPMVVRANRRLVHASNER